MSSTFVEEAHPRAKSGRFTDKTNSAPAGELTSLDDGPANPLAQRFGTVEEKIEAMRAELATGVAALADDETWKRHLDVMSRFHRYSLNNQILISIQRPDATRVAGFQVWKGLGRSVRKGEKGIAILAPKLITRRNKDTGEVEVDANWRPMKVAVGFTSATVFDVSQTDGEALPEVYQELSEEPPAGYIEDLEHAIIAHGFTVTYESTGSSALGYTDFDGKRVVIGAGLSEGSKATTLAHELGHIACGHGERRDEYHTGHDGHRGSIEVEAESFSYVLSQMNGMATNLRPASEYVASWQRHEPDAIRQVGETLQKAIKATMAATTWRNTEAA